MKREAGPEFNGGKMKKELSEMSLEELWKMFPIYLTEYQPSWKEWYADEENRKDKLYSGKYQYFRRNI